MFEESVVDSPNVIMKVTERGGEDVKSAQVGDPLELHFEIFDEQSPYEIFVRDLVAKDGNDQAEIVLIDSRGCPAEGQIMGPLVKDPESGNFKNENSSIFSDYNLIFCYSVKVSTLPTAEILSGKNERPCV